MARTADSIRAIVEGSSFLHFGMREGLLNLSQVARHLQPLIEERTRAEVQVSAIVMALSRLQPEIRRQRSGAATPPRARVRHASLRGQLELMTFDVTHELVRPLETVCEKARRQGGYNTLTIGMDGITIAVDDTTRRLLGRGVGRRPTRVRRAVAGISLSTDPRGATTSNLLQGILEHLTLHGVGVIHVASAGVVIHAYVAERDARIAFHLVHARFAAQNRRKVVGPR